MTHQGFIGSLGTSFLLVSSAVAILLIVGAIVAFEGFPGPSVDDSTQPFEVRGLGSGGRPEPEFAFGTQAGGAGAAGAASGIALAPPAAEVAAAGLAAPPAEPAPPDAPPVPPTAPPAGDPANGGSGSGGSSDDGGLVATLRETLRETTRVLQSTVDKLLPGDGSSLNLRRPG